jgi:hypothetical protein
MPHEVCTIRAAKEPMGLLRIMFADFGLAWAKASLWAQATGPNGEYVAARSSKFDAHGRWGIDHYEQAHNGQAALDELVRTLISDGWHPLLPPTGPLFPAAGGRIWYERQFQREVA